MKKLNNKGFILAETLVVTVFLMVIFTMLYTNYYPLMGEYQKRENYDDVDGKYVAYWMKKLIEDASYMPPPEKKQLLDTAGYLSLIHIGRCRRSYASRSRWSPYP